MKKIAYFLSIGALASMIVFSGCKKDEEVDTTACENQSFPSNTGTATVAIKNYTNVVGNYTVVDASAGDNLSFAVEITKGTNRPQKLRVYQTDCENKVGDKVTLPSQPGLEDSDTRIDLRNTDDAQLRQFLYTVPTGMSTIYLNIEIDESGDKYTYKRVKLNVSGSGIVDSWSNITLGAQTHAAASRMSSGTGQTYAACNAAANMEYIDIIYSWNTSGYLSSNPASFSAPIGRSVSNPSCGDDGSLPTNGGTITYFEVYSGGDFATITDAQLSALTVSTASQYVSFAAAGSVYKFENAKGKKGLIRVNSYTTDVDGSVNVDVKVQR
jgi:hypothetical protein